MRILNRPMLPSDVSRCVSIIASIPAACTIYGDALGELGQAWLRLLKCEAQSAMLFEEVAPGAAKICAIGVSVFVRDDFVRQLKERPFWFARELTRQLARGDSPLLTERQLREANTRGGLTVLVWEGRIAPGFHENAEVYRKVANVFLEEHRGFLWKEAIACQIETVEQLHASIQAGGLIWDPVARRYGESLPGNPEEFISAPHVVGMTRGTEAHRPGSWLGVLFDYQPPQFGFSHSEQRLLNCALDGGTDQELGDRLGLARDTVKKTWRLIYNRVAAQSPELIPSNSELEDGKPERGRAKKQRLINYLREHPEELRPHSRKLLRRNPTSMR